MHIHFQRHALALLVGALLSAPTMAEPLSDEAAIQLMQRLDQMEREVSGLRGENEQLRNDLQSVQRNQKDTLDQVDERLDKIKSNPVDKPADNTSGNGSSNTSNPSTLPNPSSSSSTLPSSNLDDKAKNNDPNSYYSYGTNKSDDPNANLPKPATSSTDAPKPADSSSSASSSSSNSSASSPTSASGNNTNDSKPVTKAEEKAIPSTSERSAYDDAFNMLLKTPKEATPMFRKFLKDYPNSSLAPSAQYWIGESLYAEKDYKTASDEFLSLLKEHKSSEKAPGAALKLGYCFYELKDWDKARKTLEDVISFFPDNAETKQKAQERLDRMKTEGH